MAPHPHQLLHGRAGIQEGSRQASVFGVGISFIVVIAALISVRMYVRMFMIKAVGLDDNLHVRAFRRIDAQVREIRNRCRGWTDLADIQHPAAYYGVGKHIDEIPLTDMVPMLQSVYSTRLLYCVAMFFVKQSLLVFYLRLDHRRVMRWTVYTLMFVVAALNIASGVVLAVSCFPPALFWDVEGVVDGECMAPGAQQAFYDANGYLKYAWPSTSIITDIAIYVAPMPMLWNIQIPLRQKIALLGVFGLGFFSVAGRSTSTSSSSLLTDRTHSLTKAARTAGCVRFGYVRKLSGETDMYFLLADSLNWCELEIYVAIFCGSAPAFKVLLKSWFPRMFGSSNHQTPDYQHNGGHSNKSNNSGGGGKRSGSTEIPHENDSKEAIMMSGNRIVRKTEFTMEVED
ncbi:hypothetical protein PG994_003196 [Apiospora phragmitis]|uniref:Rhodopsin domain-containing protein n=1 Tax=Apiospora phragmitis TaxID=2905665 RepID=A0ABR1VXG7_9PEZI